MKQLALMLMVLFTFSLGLSFSLPYDVFGGDKAKCDEFMKNKEQAQALKKTGDYLGAAKLHPQSLCRAWYYWNHACSLIGTRNSSNDWVYSKAKSANATDALAMLDVAESELKTPDEFGCKGADADTLTLLIDSVRKTILSSK